MKYEIVNANCLDWMEYNTEHIDMIFADPPDNIGLGYECYVDKLDHDEYVGQLTRWINVFCNIADTVWLSFNSKWLIDVAQIAGHLKNITVRPCVQTFTFYQHCKTDMGNAHRPLWRFSKQPIRTYPNQVRVESWRQKNGDKRAAQGGKVPGDHFDFPRVVGTSKQRRTWHPTQLHEGLVERCVKFSTLEGDYVVDPFAETGTTLRVCQRINRSCTTIEIVPQYCEMISKEMNT